MTGLEIGALLGLGYLFVSRKKPVSTIASQNTAGIGSQRSAANNQASQQAALQQAIQKILSGGNKSGGGGGGFGGGGTGAGGKGTASRPTQVQPGDPNLQVGDLTGPDLASGAFTTSGAFVQSAPDGTLITTLPSGDVVSSSGVTDLSGSLIQVPTVDTSFNATPSFAPENILPSPDASASVTTTPFQVATDNTSFAPTSFAPEGKIDLGSGSLGDSTGFGDMLSAGF